MSANGLEGVIAADTRLSDVDGERGRLILAGHDVEELARHARFEDAAALLLDQRADELRAQLGAARVAAFDRLPRLGDALAAADAMDALRAGVAHLSGESSPAAIIGAVAVIAAAWSRRRAGKDPLPPDAQHSHAADYLRMATGAEPDAARVAALDAYLVTVIDHGMNASTFTARVVASTGSDLVSAVVAAIGALKGPLHGGANAAVMDMLQEVGSVENADRWVRDALANKKRIMGFGHRVYKVYDPRATVLKKFSEELGERAGEPQWFKMSEKIEKVVLEAKKLNPNVDFYSASTYHVLGLDTFIFTPIFALSRMAGWTAHVLEQYESNRLMRPESEYIGPPSAVYIPLDQRG
jgi:citrate synthase